MIKRGDFFMQALFLVLHKTEKLDDLLVALQNNGITGGTIIESKGMVNALKSSDNFIIESLRIILEDPRETSKTLFFILKNDEVAKVRKSLFIIIHFNHFFFLTINRSNINTVIFPF